MKKTVKTTLAILTAMTMTAGAMGVTAYAEEAVQTTAIVSESVQTEGVFSQGAAYHFIKGSDALIIDGEGSFTAEEFDAIVEEFNPRAIAFDNEVTPPDGSEDDYAWICGILHYSNSFVVYTRDTSILSKERNKMLNYLAEKTGTKKSMLSAMYNLIELAQFKASYDPVVTRDFVEMFTYEQTVLDMESKVMKYLVDKGINEDIAREFTGCYLNGLNIRVRNYIDGVDTVNKANPDGTEISERTKTRAMVMLLNAVSQKQEFLGETDSSEYTDDVSKLMIESGIKDDGDYTLLTISFALKSSLACSVNVCSALDNVKESETLLATEPKTESVVEETENVPTTIAEAEPETEAAATVKGDADVNGAVGLSDVVAVSKHNINSTAYPLANETAEANADMNNDNVVDGLDTSALVEYNLGKK